MQLISSPTSPFARKVRAVILEKGLQDEIEVVNASPLDSSAQTTIQNPLGKVPCLIRPNGAQLFDSTVICAYLDERGSEPLLTPQGGDSRWMDDRAHALGNGIMEAAFNTVMERKRTDAAQSEFWLERWQQAILRGLDDMEQNLFEAHVPLTLGTISCMCALGYLDLRLGEINWRKSWPRLANFESELASRKCFALTKPPQQ